MVLPPRILFIVDFSSVEDGFKALFPSHSMSVEGVKVSSGVSDQPISSSETLRGACQRAEAAQQNVPGAEFYVGVEGTSQTPNACTSMT